MISPTGISNIANYIKSQLARGTYTIGGVKKDTPIYKTVLTGSTLTVHLYVGNTEAGSITKSELIDIAGMVFADKPDSITKTSTKGVLITYKFTISEV